MLGHLEAVREIGSRLCTQAALPLFRRSGCQDDFADGSTTYCLCVPRMRPIREEWYRNKVTLSMCSSVHMRLPTFTV
jgi:hypothetical protein